MNDHDQLTGRPQLVELADQVRASVLADGARGGSRTWQTADGEVTIDYRAGDYLRITFAGDARERTHVFPPDWPASGT